MNRLLSVAVPRDAVSKAPRRPISPRVGMRYVKRAPRPSSGDICWRTAWRGGEFGDRTHVGLRYEDHDFLERFLHTAFTTAQNDFRATCGDFEALATQRLKEDRKMQLTASGNNDPVSGCAIASLGTDADAQADIGLELAVEAFTQLAGRDRPAILTGKRTGIRADGQLDGRFGDRQAGKRLRFGSIRNRVTDRDRGDARDRDQVAGTDFLNRISAETLEREEFKELEGHGGRIVAKAPDRHAPGEGATDNPSDRNAPTVGLVVQGRHEDLHRPLHVRDWGGTCSMMARNRG